MSDEKKHTTEELLKQKLEGFEMPVEDFVFDAIKAEVAPAMSKSKRSVWFWMFTAGVLSLLLMMLLYLFSPLGKRVVEKEELPASQPVVEEKSLVSANPLVDSNKIEETLSVKNNFSDKQLQQTETNSKENAQKSKTLINRKLVKEESTITAKVQTNDPTLKEKETVPADRTVEIVSQEPTNNKVGSAVSPSTSQIVEVNFNSSSVIPAVDNNDLKEAVNDEVGNQGNAIPVVTPNPEKLDEKKNIPRIPTDGEKMEFLPQPNKATSFDEVSDGRSKFSLQALGGVGFSYRLLNSSANQDLETHKNDHERSGITYSYGLQTRYHIKDWLYVGLGVGYASFSERYAFHHDIITHETTNTYNYFQVPATVGIRLFESKRFLLNAQGGMVWNALTEAQSSWVDPNDLQAVSHNNVGAQHPFQENTWESILGLEIAFKINPRWQISLIPSASIFLNSVYQESTNLDQKPYSGFVNVGILRRF